MGPKRLPRWILKLYFSDPNGTKIRLIRGILWKTGPDAIGSPLDTPFGAHMEPIGLQLGMGTAATWKQK